MRALNWEYKSTYVVEPSWTCHRCRSSAVFHGLGAPHERSQQVPFPSPSSARPLTPEHSQRRLQYMVTCCCDTLTRTTHGTPPLAIRFLQGLRRTRHVRCHQAMPCGIQLQLLARSLQHVLRRGAGSCADGLLELQLRDVVAKRRRIIWLHRPSMPYDDGCY